MQDVRELVQAIRKELETAQIREDYVEIVHADTLRPLTKLSVRKSTI